MAVLLLLLLLLPVMGISAEPAFRLNADYNMPIGNQQFSSNVGFGAGVKFWGIFVASGNIYTEIIYGAENIFNINSFRPIGLFSWGLGIDIPIGGISLIMDWQNFYTGIGYERVDKYSDSYKIGLSVDISSNFALQFYSRKLFRFTQNALDSDIVEINSADETVQMIGAGVVLKLF